MKKVLLAAASVFISLAIPALAAWNDDLQAAINSGNYTKIDQIAAANPDAQGQIALLLLHQAQSKAQQQPSPDMCAAASLLESATPLMSQVPGPNKQEATTIVDALGQAANAAQNQDNACAKKILADIQDLEDTALLAQQPGLPPGVSPTGAIVPSAE